MSKKVLLIGYLGANNFGDEIMLRQFIKQHSEYNNINIMSYGLQYEKIFPDREVSTFYFAINSKRSNLTEYLNALRGVDQVVWVGGTCFTDCEGDGAFKYFLLSKAFLKKFSYVNVGIGDIKKSWRKVKLFITLSLVDYISFRDSFSLEYSLNHSLRVKNIDQSVTEDLGDVFLLSLKKRYASKNKGDGAVARSLVIAWRELKGYVRNQDKLINIIVNEINKKKSSYNKIIFINTDEIKDKRVTELLLDRISGVNVFYYPDICIERKLKLIVSSSKILTSRLHILAAANIFGKKCAVFNYANKIELYLDGLENNLSCPREIELLCESNLAEKLDKFL